MTPRVVGRGELQIIKLAVRLVLEVGRSFLPRDNMLSFAVTEIKQKHLRERMAEVGLREEDVDERFIRSSGCGGQHVNKNSTCVQLIHKPTGIEVKCMQERSQSVNRFLARRFLAEKLAQHLGLPSAATDKEQGIRRKKARKKRRVAAKTLKESID